MNPILGLLSLLCWAFILSGCSDIAQRSSLHPQHHREIFKNIAHPAPSSYLSQPTSKPKPKTKEETIPKALLKTVSISINEQTPIKEVLLTLAEQAGVDLQLSKDVDVSMNYTARNKPFYHVLRQICDLGDLKLLRDGTSIRIETDKPYSKNYNVQFLNIERQSQNRISVATDVFTQQSKNNNNLDNGSNSEVTVQGHNHFWSEIESNIKTILSHTQQQGQFSIHKQAGIIAIYATQKQHVMIQEYLDQIKFNTSRQVLVEAKIIEVTLKDGFKSGINWQRIGESGLAARANFASLAASGPYLDSTFADREGVELGAKNGQFSGILHALEEFGTSRTLSSPRLMVMNNQTALLKVAQNHVYFKINYDRQTSAHNNLQNVNVSSDIQTVPIGLVMSVQPSIDDETGDIILFLRPTISKLSQTVADPAVDLAHAANQNTSTSQIKQSLVPVVDVKEMDTILRVQSGDVGVLGGLMEVKTKQSQSGLPGMRDIPIIKDLFTGQGESDEVIEYVILLKVSIIDQSNPTPADQRMMNEYVTDARPL